MSRSPLSVPVDSSRLGPEICRRLPPGAQRILELGGVGAPLAELLDGRPEIEALRIGAEGRIPADDLLPALAELRSGGERFDVVVLIEVLARVADPFDLMEAATAVARPGALLMATAENVAGVRLLDAVVGGRFVPVADEAGRPQPLRWFTRGSLRELFEETGLRGVTIDPLQAVGDGKAFLEALEREGIPFRADELSASRWIATGRVETR